MLFHATITHFRKDAQSPLSLCRRVFIRRTRPADVVTPLLGIRSYGIKRPSSPPKSPTLRGHNGERGPPRTSVDLRHQDITCSNVSVPTNHPVNDDLSSRRRKSMLASHVATPSLPSTKWELYTEILRLLALSPPAPFSRLISLHRRHPTLQSVESSNLLLNLSIRHSFSRHTQSLLASMSSNEIRPNVITEKLVVRYMATRGRWRDAWQQVMKRYPSVADIPIAVLLELLAPGTRNFPRPKLIRTRKTFDSGVESRARFRPRRLNQPLERVEDGAPAVKIPLDTLVIILHRFPQLPLDELARLPPRVVSYAVRGLIRNGHQESALILTENHLKALPPIIDSRQRDFARDLVHLHLSSGELKLANYKKKRRLVEHLFALHPSLHPNAKTVFLLMRYMGQSKRCGIEAYLLFKDYRARWGAAVESLEVRRRIVAYALKQRKYGIAKEISLEWTSGHLSLQSLVADTSSLAPLRMRPWRTMYPRKGKGARLWKRLLIRLLGRRRAWKRRLYKWPWPT